MINKRPWYFYWLPLLVAVFAVAAGWLGHNLATQAASQERDQELRAQQIHTLCEAENETRAIVFGVLEFLAEPRDDDEPGEYERRQQLLEHFRVQLAPRDCLEFTEIQVSLTE